MVVCVQTVAKTPELWSRYFKNFISSKLHLAALESTIEKQIIQEVFCDLETFEITEKIVYLHTYMAVYQLDLAKVATILRSLALLQRIKTVSPAILSTPPPPPTKHSVSQSGSALSDQHLSTFVINALFKALHGCLYAGLSQTGALEQLKQWYKAYLDIIMTLPSLADIISAGLAMCDEAADMEQVRAQSNVMQATFAVLQCKPDCDSEVLNVGQKVFRILFTRHFKENGEVLVTCVFVWANNAHTCICVYLFVLRYLLQLCYELFECKCVVCMCVCGENIFGFGSYVIAPV